MALVRERRAAVLKSEACEGGFLVYTLSHLRRIVQGRGYKDDPKLLGVSFGDPKFELYHRYEGIVKSLNDLPLGSEVPGFVGFLKAVNEIPVYVHSKVEEVVEE